MSQTWYTNDHEWVRLEGGIATVGITQHASAALGDLVYVGLPDPGHTVTAGEQAAVVDSVKAASDVFAPLAGTVIEVNSALADNPALANESPEDAGWFFKLQLSGEPDLAGLLDREAYERLLGETE